MEKIERAHENAAVAFDPHGHRSVPVPGRRQLIVSLRAAALSLD